MSNPLKSLLPNLIVKAQYKINTNTEDEYGNPSFTTEEIYLDLSLKQASTSNYLRSIMSAADNRTEYIAYINEAYRLVRGNKVKISAINIGAIVPEMTFSGGKAYILREKLGLSVIESVFGKKISLLIEGLN